MVVATSAVDMETVGTSVTDEASDLLTAAATQEAESATTATTKTAATRVQMTDALLDHSYGSGGSNHTGQGTGFRDGGGAWVIVHRGSATGTGTGYGTNGGGWRRGDGYGSGDGFGGDGSGDGQGPDG